MQRSIRRGPAYEEGGGENKTESWADDGGGGGGGSTVPSIHSCPWAWSLHDLQGYLVPSQWEIQIKLKCLLSQPKWDTEGSAPFTNHCCAPKWILLFSSWEGVENSVYQPGLRVLHCMTLAMLFKFSVPQYLPLKNKDGSPGYLTGLLWGVREDVGKNLAEHLVCNKCSIDDSHASWKPVQERSLHTHIVTINMIWQGNMGLPP